MVEIKEAIVEVRKFYSMPNYWKATLIGLFGFPSLPLPAPSLCWWVALTWTIWQQRNRIVFSNETFNGSKLMDDAVF